MVADALAHEHVILPPILYFKLQKTIITNYKYITGKIKGNMYVWMYQVKLK